MENKEKQISSREILLACTKQLNGHEIKFDEELQKLVFLTNLTNEVQKIGMKKDDYELFYKLVVALIKNNNCTHKIFNKKTYIAFLSREMNYLQIKKGLEKNRHQREIYDACWEMCKKLLNVIKTDGKVKKDEK